MIKAMRTATLAVVLACVLAGCPWGEAAKSGESVVTKAFQRASVVAGRPASADEIGVAGRELTGVPEVQLTRTQIEDRQLLLARLSTASKRLAEQAVDARIPAAQARIPPLANDIVSSVVPAPTVDGDPWKEFRIALVKETEEALKSWACGKFLEYVAPDQRSVEEQEQAKSQSEMIQGVIDDLRTVFTQGADVGTALNWAGWANGVAADAGQVASAVEAYPETYAQIFQYPAVQRGAVAYLRFCHPVPRSI